eukprot:5295146-Prymnesium_polylepis.1
MPSAERPTPPHSAAERPTPLHSRAACFRLPSLPSTSDLRTPTPPPLSDYMVDERCAYREAVVVERPEGKSGGGSDAAGGSCHVYTGTPAVTRRWLMADG